MDDWSYLRSEEDEEIVGYVINGQTYGVLPDGVNPFDRNIDTIWSGSGQSNSTCSACGNVLTACTC